MLIDYKWFSKGERVRIVDETPYSTWGIQHERSWKGLDYSPSFIRKDYVAIDSFVHQAIYRAIKSIIRARMKNSRRNYVPRWVKGEAIRAYTGLTYDSFEEGIKTMMAYGIVVSSRLRAVDDTFSIRNPMSMGLGNMKDDSRVFRIFTPDDKCNSLQEWNKIKPSVHIDVLVETDGKHYYCSRDGIIGIHRNLDAAMSNFDYDYMRTKIYRL